MKRGDVIFSILLMATVMEGVVVNSPDAKTYVPGFVLWLLPALNAGIAVWLKQLVPFLSSNEQKVLGQSQMVAPPPPTSAMAH